MLARIDKYAPHASMAAATPSSNAPKEISYGRPISADVLDRAFHEISRGEEDEMYYEIRAMLSEELTRTFYDPYDGLRHKCMRFLYDMNEMAERGRTAVLNRNAVVQMWQLSHELSIPRLQDAPLWEINQSTASRVENMKTLCTKTATQIGSSEFQTLCFYLLAEIIMCRTNMETRIKLSDGSMPALNAEACRVSKDDRKSIGKVRGDYVFNIKDIFARANSSAVFAAAAFCFTTQKVKSIGCQACMVPPSAVLRDHPPDMIKILMCPASNEIQVQFTEGPDDASSAQDKPGEPKMRKSVRMKVSDEDTAWNLLFHAVMCENVNRPRQYIKLPF